jgi:hypothetical protein
MDGRADSRSTFPHLRAEKPRYVINPMMAGAARCGVGLGQKHILWLATDQRNQPDVNSVMASRLATKMDKKIILDENAASYEPFYDYEWAEALMRKAEGTQLDRTVSDLCASWRGASNTHIIPWIVMGTFKVFDEAVTKLFRTYLSHMATTMGNLLVKEMGTKLRNMQQKPLRDAVTTVSTSLHSMMNEDEFHIDVHHYWHEYLKKADFQYSIWASQRLCYAAIYYAFEDFLIRCVKLASGKEKCRTQDKDFKAVFREHFGDELLEKCWLDPKVNVARLVRHAIAHAGGRVTADLMACKHGLDVIDGELQVLLDDTKGLFSLLKERVQLLADAALALPIARITPPSS